MLSNLPGCKIVGTEKYKSHGSSQGLTKVGKILKGYIIGGLMLHNKGREDNRKTENSGVVITTKASCLDNDVVDYGVLKG